jgi:hypothetical protein
MSQSNEDLPASYPIDAVKTWRHLRLAMVAIIVALGAAVLYEHFQVKGRDCFQTSISAYYYTPARAVLVAALVSIGVAMVCLRGNTPGEDLLLNLAGIFAPIVALVPTLEPSTCSSVESATEARGANIANNLFALLIAGALALAFALWRWSRERPTPRAGVVLAITIVIWAAVLSVYEYAGDSFDRNAHGVAATAMFVCIIGVACLNVREFKRLDRQRSYWNRYTPVAVAMVLVLLAQVAIMVEQKITGDRLWAHQTILVETVLLLLFAGFWVLQTAELWDKGLRPTAKSS